MPSPRGSAVFAAAALLLAAGCAGATGNVGTAPAPTANEPSASSLAPSGAAAPATPTTVAGAPSGQAPAPAPAKLVADVPDVEVVDVAGGTKVRLHSLFTGDKPVLLWFWAPH